MNRILRIWRASFVRRWHTNFDLCDTVDPNSGHQGRVALLVLALKPDASRHLLIAALTHDQGEAGAGADMAGDAKRRCPQIANLLADEEMAELSLQGFAFGANLTENEQRLFSLCDKLDAFLWMMRHARHLYARPDWVSMRRRILEQANSAGVGAEVEGLLDAECVR